MLDHNIIDIENNPKIKESEGYLQWAKIHNLQEQSKTFNYMSEHGLLSGRQLDEELEVLHAAFDQAKTQLKVTETRLKEVNRLLRLLGQYYHTKNTYLEYKKSKNKAVFHEEHHAQLELHDAAVKELRSIYGEDKFPAVSELKKEKAKLAKQKEEQYEIYRQTREKWMEVGTIVRNRDSFLAKLHGQEREDTTKG